MKDQIQKLIDELNALKEPTGYQIVARGALITARDNLKFHDEATAKPKADTKPAK